MIINDIFSLSRITRWQRKQLRILTRAATITTLICHVRKSTGFLFH